MDDREETEQSRAQIIDLAAALKESMVREAEAKYPVRAGAKASRGKKLTIANLTDQEVEVRMIPTEPDWTGADSLELVEPRECLSEAEYNRLTAALAANPGLEHALDVAEEVGIGPGDGDTATIREHLLEMEAERVWLGTCDAVLDDLEDATVEDGGLLMDQPATRSGMELIDPRDGGRWLTVTRPKPPREPRFGERLREWLSNSFLTPAEAPFCAALSALADAIDQDADRLRTWALDEVGRQDENSETKRRAAILGDLKRYTAGDLRRQVEEAVERQRYGVHLGTAGHDKDVLDAEPFLAELGQIFGGRS